jgi:hypothetical protein
MCTSGNCPYTEVLRSCRKADRLVVLVAALRVGHPLAVAPAVVQVQHGGDRVHAQAVEVVLLQPEDRIADQEVADLVAPVVEDQAVPLRVEAQARVLVLVQVRAVEAREGMRVGREVRRHPVQEDADALLVQRVDEDHQVLRRAVARARCVVPGGLVAPGAVEGVLVTGISSTCVKPRVVAVHGQAPRQVAVVEEATVLLALPRAQVHFVDGDRRAVRLTLRSGAHPLGIAPFVRQVPDLRGGARRMLHAEGHRGSDLSIQWPPASWMRYL